MRLPAVVTVLLHVAYLGLTAPFVRSWRSGVFVAGVLALLWALALFYLTIERNRTP